LQVINIYYFFHFTAFFSGQPG